MKNEYDYTDIEKKLHALKGVSLSAREKLQSKELLEEFMAFRPIHTTVPKLSRSPLFFFHPMPMVALLLLVVMTTSTAAAAEGALPGDLLYPIKVHVTEEVRAVIAIQPTAKASWAIERAERRLDEAAQLSTENRLDDSKRAELALAVENHVQVAEALVELPVAAIARETSHTEGTAPFVATTTEEVPPTLAESIDEGDVEEAQERERVFTRIAIAREAKSRIIERHVALAETTTETPERTISRRESENSNRSRNRRSKVKIDAPIAATLPIAAEPAPLELDAMMLAVEQASATPETASLAMSAEIATSSDTSTTSAASDTPDVENHFSSQGRLMGLQEGVLRRIESAERSLTNAEASYGKETFADVRSQLEKVKELAIAGDRNADEVLEDAEDALEKLLDVLEKTQGKVELLRLELSQKENDY